MDFLVGMGTSSWNITESFFERDNLMKIMLLAVNGSFEVIDVSRNKYFSEGSNGMKMSLGVPGKKISRWALFLTHEWVDLMACMPNETGSVLNTLVRRTSSTRGVLDWLFNLEPTQKHKLLCLIMDVRSRKELRRKLII